MSFCVWVLSYTCIYGLGLRYTAGGRLSSGWCVSVYCSLFNDVVSRAAVVELQGCVLFVFGRLAVLKASV